jgi:hypothetical protein
MDLIKFGSIGVVVLEPRSDLIVTLVMFRF